jgi:lipoprotein-anchoring transpeptidase ErfK/SrfK
MGGPGKHAGAPVPWFPNRLGITAALSALVAVAAIVAAVVANSAGTGPAARPSAGPVLTATANVVPAVPGRWPGGVPSVAASARRAAMPLVLTGVDHQNCPAAASACVDLSRHITWLQGAGKITFGPVRMEPGKPGSQHPTPRGTFRVSWKAGPSFMSNIYNEPMPWATFFAPGGIAFHGGSLTKWSHGCIHLTVSNAHYYNQHLPIGAEVVVF